MITAIAIALEVLLGWLLADLLSGIFHFLEDRYGREDWPVLGKWVIAPNRLHHAQPLAFTRAGFGERNGTTILAAAIVAAPLLLLLGPQIWLLSAAIGGALSNQVHYWAHRPGAAPALVRLVQRTGLLQGAKHHQLHHATPHDRRYCVLTSWLNPILDRNEVWAKAERLLPAGWRA